MKFLLSPPCGLRPCYLAKSHDLHRGGIKKAIIITSAGNSSSFICFACNVFHREDGEEREFQNPTCGKRIVLRYIYFFSSLPGKCDSSGEAELLPFIL